MVRCLLAACIAGPLIKQLGILLDNYFHDAGPSVTSCEPALFRDVEAGGLWAVQRAGFDAQLQHGLRHAGI